MKCNTVFGNCYYKLFFVFSVNFFINYYNNAFFSLYSYPQSFLKPFELKLKFSGISLNNLINAVSELLSIFDLLSSTKFTVQSRSRSNLLNSHNTINIVWLSLFALCRYFSNIVMNLLDLKSKCSSFCDYNK